jgi:hypothetical protein
MSRTPRPQIKHVHRDGRPIVSSERHRRRTNAAEERQANKRGED